MIQGRMFRFLVAFYIALGLGALIPLLMWRELAEPAQGISAPLCALGVCLLAAVRLGQLAVAAQRRLLSITFWLFVYVWLGVAPLAQLLTGRLPHGGHYEPGRFVFAYVVIVTGLVSYELGHRCARGTGGLILGRVKEVLASRRITVTRATLLAAVSVSVAGYLAIRLGGAETLIASRSDVFRAIQEFSGGVHQERLQPIMRLLRVPPFVAVYILIWLWRVRGSQLNLYSRLITGLLLAVSLGLCLLTSNPLNSARYWFGTITLSVLFVFLPSRRSMSYPILVVTMLAALLIVFPYADLFRSEISVDTFEFHGFDPWTEKADYDAYQQLVNAVDHADEQGFQRGRQISGTLLFWVPRAIWAGKPVPSGELVAQARGYNYTNLSMPLWGEAYLDGGILFTGVLLFFYGLGSGAVERLHGETGHGRDNLAGYLVPILAAYQIFLLRGALLSTFSYLVPILMMIWLSTGRRTQLANEEAK